MITDVALSGNREFESISLQRGVGCELDFLNHGRRRLRVSVCRVASSDGKTWTFKIRQGVKFHNGDPLTAADVAASLNEIAFPPKGALSPRSDVFMMVKDIAAPDPTTVKLRDR